MRSQRSIAVRLPWFAVVLAVLLPALLIGLLPAAHALAHIEDDRRSARAHTCAHDHHGEHDGHPEGPAGGCGLCEQLLLVFGSAALVFFGIADLRDSGVSLAEASGLGAGTTREIRLHLARGPPAA